MLPTNIPAVTTAWLAAMYILPTTHMLYINCLKSSLEWPKHQSYSTVTKADHTLGIEKKRTFSTAVMRIFIGAIWKKIIGQINFKQCMWFLIRKVHYPKSD